MNQSNSILAGLTDIFVDPKKALTAADANKGWTLLPFLLVLGTSMLAQVYYFATVDIDWFADYMIAAQVAAGNEMPPEAASFFTRNTMMITSVVGVVIMISAILAIQALYLHLVAKTTTADDRKFGDWFKLSVWTAMPSVVIALAILINYALAGTTQFAPENLNFLSANALIAHIPPGQPGASFMDSLSLSMLWGLGLLALGLQLWTKRSFGKSLVIAVAPYVVIYGIWGAVAFG